MTRSKYDSKNPIENKDSAALFGYLITCNNQIHSFQQTAIKEFFERKELDYEEVRKVIGRKEDCITFENAWNAFKNELPPVRNEIYFYLYVVSCIDGFSDKKEKEFFDYLKKNSVFENISQLEAVAAKKAETERKRMKNENAANHTGRRSSKSAAEKTNLFRVSQKEYISSLSKCRRIAKEDFETIKPVCDSVIQKGKVFSSAVDKELNSSKQFKAESRTCLVSLAASIKTVVKDSEYYKSELDRKESAIEDFTIAFFGKSKAGKSTLRAVLTGEGKENIGNGSTRTTRVNDIYEWNHLRIIDTPGIAAGNDLKGEDRQIAEKAIGEADVICIVSMTDGVDTEVREFIINIAKRNKPVIVLINNKDNLLDEDIFDDFTDCPDAWKDENNPKGAMGYSKIIYREMKENGVGSLVTFYPVHLLAALLSEDEKYCEYSKLLRENSGIDEFLASLKIIVFEQGCFLRSKTIIDDVIRLCCDWKNRVSEPVDGVKKARDSLNAEMARLKTNLERTRKSFVTDSVKSVENIYATLATTYAREFADENFNAKGKIGEKFSEFCKEKQIENKLKNELSQNLNLFQENVQRIISDVIDNVTFDFKYDNGISEDLKKTFDIPFKEITNLISPLISIAAFVLSFFNIIGTTAAAILYGISTVLGISSDFMPKKADRDKKRKDSLYKRLNEIITDAKKSKTEEIKVELEKKSKQIIENIINKYSDLIRGIGYVADRGSSLVADMDCDLNELNMIFAKRLMEFISTENNYRVEAVERKFGESIKIFVSGKHNADISKLCGLINEKVTIVRMD